MKKYYIYLFLFLYAIAAVITIYVFDGTGDAGDSIHHYLFAKYAPVHPHLFFDHWAKPVFVLLASPFAQFGFTGVKIFNVIATIFTILFTYKTAKKLQLKNSLISAIILIFTPLYFVLTFSGLTEPLFAMFLSIGLFLVLDKRNIAAAIVISFLPFVRSEGIIILSVFGLFFLYKKEWKIIPFLLTGHVIYSIAGYFVYHDILWVFTRIPYARLSSTYGSGDLFHFVSQMLYVTGIPVYLLFLSGIIAIIWKSINKSVSSEIIILILGGFLAFIIAHSLFWYLGIFNSMGLNRVLISVVPLITIIALIGFNFFTEEIIKNKKLSIVIQIFFLGYLLIFPFTNNPASINWKREMMLSEDQKTALLISNEISGNKNISSRLVYAHPYLSEAFGIDHFDPAKRIELTQEYLTNIKSGDIIIWENWFCVIEKGITKEQMLSTPGLVNILDITNQDRGHEINYMIFISE